MVDLNQHVAPASQAREPFQFADVLRLAGVGDNPHLRKIDPDLAGVAVGDDDPLELGAGLPCHRTGQPVEELRVVRGREQHLDWSQKELLRCICSRVFRGNRTPRLPARIPLTVTMTNGGKSPSIRTVTVSPAMAAPIGVGEVTEITSRLSGSQMSYVEIPC